MKSRKSFLTLAFGLALLGSLANLSRPEAIKASDHDDGETGTKARNVNLTDLYVFREVDQMNQVDSGTRTFGDPTDDPNRNMVFIMNTNPRSLPRQQYFFNEKARYEFWVKQVDTSVNAANDFTNNRSNGVADVCYRFTFGTPTAGGQQAITLSRLFCNAGVPDEATATTVSAGVTTPAVPGLGTPAAVVNTVNITTNGNTDSTSVFAGLREDPFFLDVTQFFRVRAGAAGAGPAVGFRAAAAAIDFTKDYNVNSIVFRMPRALLQRLGNGTLSASTTFDVWETVSVMQ